MEKKSLIVFFLFGIAEVISLWEGDQCKLRTGQDGECRMYNDCPSANRNYRNKFGKPSQYQTCGFLGNNALICCPEVSQPMADGPKPNDGGGDTIYFPGDDDPLSWKPSYETTKKPVVNRGNVATRTAVSKANQACEKYTADRPTSVSTHILGGEEVKDGEFPHMVALGYRNGDTLKFDCGGTLISERYVLTAAHCVKTQDKIAPSVVRVGSIYLDSQDAVDYTVVEEIVHPQYKRPQQYYDIALLKLDKDVETSNNVYMTACLDTNQSDPKEVLIVTGWGSTTVEQNEKSKILLKANLTSVNQQRCNQTHGLGNKLRLPNGIVGNGQLCAVDVRAISDSCGGDSGGPLQKPLGDEGMYTLVGITSFGKGCGGGIPAVYTRVSYYLDWITSNVWP